MGAVGREEYCRRVGEVVRGVEEREEWEKVKRYVSRSVKTATREVCGVVRGGGEIAQPWMVGREEEVSRLSEEIRFAVQDRDSLLEISRARNRLRPRRGNEVGRQLEGARNWVNIASIGNIGAPSGEERGNGGKGL